ncbi:MAG: SGNH/GDSL hydrolase family protein, partial [Ruminococcus sp.]|nr:SGNH/GDSL hydrolase family protein [Ruminococcus sp.]
SEKKATNESSASAGADDSGSEGGLKAPVSDSPIDITRGMTENMLTRSVHFEGDTSRLSAKLQKAKSGSEPFNIVFLGDSITAGSTTSNFENTYVTRFSLWWKENFNADTTITNSGIGATNSYLGVHRLDTDVFAYSPDIIFVEFINDSGDPFYEATMESLIRRCLAYENDPAVILIEMSLEGGGNAQDLHSPSAEKYGVPVLSYHDAIAPEVEAGNISFKSSGASPTDTDGLSPDGTHPNDSGHLMVFQMIQSFIEGVDKNPDSAGEVTPFDTSSESITGDLYKNARLSDRSTNDFTVTEQTGFEDKSSSANFPNGWSCAGNGSTITFEMEFQNLGLLYYKTTDGKSGMVSVAIDGEHAALVDGNFANGWGNYPADIEVYRSEASAKHTVTVTILDDDTKQKFEILGWLVS